MRTDAELPEDVRGYIVGGRDAWQRRDYLAARTLFGKALASARECGSRFGEYAALHFLGNVAFNECRDDEARWLHSAALEMCWADGDDQGIATSLGSIALCDVAEGRLEAASDAYDQAISAYERAGMRDAAERLRGSREAFVARSVPIGDVIHRVI